MPFSEGADGPIFPDVPGVQNVRFILSYVFDVLPNTQVTIKFPPGEEEGPLTIIGEPRDGARDQFVTQRLDALMIRILKFMLPTSFKKGAVREAKFTVTRDMWEQRLRSDFPSNPSSLSQDGIGHLRHQLLLEPSAPLCPDVDEVGLAQRAMGSTVPPLPISSAPPLPQRQELGEIPATAPPLSSRMEPRRLGGPKVAAAKKVSGGCQCAVM